VPFGIRQIVEAARRRAAWSRHASKTMLPRERYLENLRVAMRQVRKRNLQDGCYVECGTWAGGVSFGMMDVLQQIRCWHFFDSFEGLPAATTLDGADARRQQRGGELWHDGNRADYDAFVADLDAVRRPRQETHVHRGWFEETLPRFAPDRPISILRMDGDWYESTSVILETLFDHVRDGGLILIDDYTAWPGCSRAVHDFLSKRHAGEVLREGRHGVTYMIRDVERGRL
jgi:O-methyltransferase